MSFRNMAKFKYIATTLSNQNFFTPKTTYSIPNHHHHHHHPHSIVFAPHCNIFHQSRPYFVRMCAVPKAPYSIIIIIIIIIKTNLTVAGGGSE
jgi:hypothetical protein